MAGPIPHGQQVGIKIDASAALVKIGRVQAALAVRDLLEAIGQSELRWTGLNLQEAGKTPGGQPWAQMAPLTLRRRPLRRSQYHFSSPYQALLQQSMVMSVDVAGGAVSIGTNARYAAEHHMGVPGRNLPARKLLSEPTGARARAKLILDAIVKKLAMETGR